VLEPELAATEEPALVDCVAHHSMMPRAQCTGCNRVDAEEMRKITKLGSVLAVQLNQRFVRRRVAFTELLDAQHLGVPGGRHGLVALVAERERDEAAFVSGDNWARLEEIRAFAAKYEEVQRQVPFLLVYCQLRGALFDEWWLITNESYHRGACDTASCVRSSGGPGSPAGGRHLI
jgi:hypothetical protein